ncbi:Multidrug resistance protein stp [Actinomadura rubteroloni]|uniref:Multidrug resistance protein stp n=1 Tax=Actinomadura rubteroloni TaxID=1926885 RepID=A0A2P4UQ92_9ACTN|nr:MFS transporter [Actinomadura rubteroloni]POM27218.1 Multidrug resistance protein stp [Actinomadura rubteroloni]
MERRTPLVALSLGYFMVMLDVTVVTVAVPAVRSSLHASAAAVQWSVDGYSAVFAGLLLAGGALGDRRGHRGVFLAGLALFTAASAGCGLARTAAELVALRLVQGAGAALLVPASLALLTAAYPDRAGRARALGIWAGVAGTAFASGPVVGGFLVAGLNWRTVFWLNVPIAACACALTLRFVPAPPPRRDAGPPDRAGQVLGVAGLTALAGGFNEAASAGWTSARTLLVLPAGSCALAAFVAVERRREASGAAPLLAPSWFRRPGFAATAAIGVLLNIGMYGLLYLATLYFQEERGRGAFATGLMLLPMAGMATVVSPLSGRLTARFGPSAPMTGALLLGAAGSLGWLAAGPRTPYPAVLFALTALGVAVPLTVPAATAAIIEAAPPGTAGVATAVFNVARQSGNAIGIAVFGTLAASDLVTGLHYAACLAAAGFLLAALLSRRL